MEKELNEAFAERMAELRESDEDRRQRHVRLKLAAVVAVICLLTLVNAWFNLSAWWRWATSPAVEIRVITVTRQAAAPGLLKGVASVPVPPKALLMGSVPQELKDAVAKACIAVAAERKSENAVFNVSEAEARTDCYRDLLAIAYVETGYDCSAVGEVGESGCFQIRTELHGLTVAEAEDPALAARWAAFKLASDGWPRYRTAAIRSYNGTGAAAEEYAKRVKSVSGKLAMLGI